MSWQEKVDSILDQLRQVDESLLAELEGCSEEDIQRIEQQFGYRLPAAYTALLRRAGRSWGELMQGEDFSFPDVLIYRKVAESVLACPTLFDALEFRLDDQDHVFFMHQRYHFLFFRVGVSEDPEVSHYEADECTVRVICDSFTDWLDICVKEDIDLRSGRVPRSYS